MFRGREQEAWLPRTSVKFRFAAAQGFFIALIISLLAASLYFLVRPRFVSISDGAYKILANNLAAGIYAPYSAGDRAGVASAVRRVEAQEGVRYVLVVSGDGTVYYDSFSGKDSLEGTLFPPDALSAAVTRDATAVGKVRRNDVAYYNYVAPLFAGNQAVYSVRIGIDGQVVDGEFDRLSKLFLTLAAAGIAFGGIAAYLLAAKLTRPIIALTESALAIRAGNLNAYPEVTTGDELEQLSREFQRMVEKLKQFYFQEYEQKKEAIDGQQRAEEINARLKELDRQKTDFLNAASHQLRTPLSIIHWSLSLIVEEADKLHIPDTEKELLTESLKSTKRMVDLVNDLLDLSRLEQGRKEMNWETANYGAVCGELVRALQPLAVNKGLELSFQQETPVRDSILDPKNFYQVVNNFVDNSIKYTKEGYVRVAVKQEGEEAVITVHDSGIGMDDGEKARLFTRFSRGNEASKMFANGSGLGMFVAHAILKAHRGSIEVTSEKGTGSAFIMRMPLLDAAPEAPAEDKSAQADIARIDRGDA